MLGRKHFADGAIADFRIFNRVVSESEAQLASDWPAIEAALQQGRRRSHRRRARAARPTICCSEHAAVHANWPREQNAVEAGGAARSARRGAITLVMQERADTKPIAHILYRGAYDQKRDEVEANTPSDAAADDADLAAQPAGLRAVAVRRRTIR